MVIPFASRVTWKIARKAPSQRVARKSIARFVAFLDVVDPATICVALRAIISISQQRDLRGNKSVVP
jgi:hypothetical protein